MKDVQEFYDEQWSSAAVKGEENDFLVMMDSAIAYSYEQLGNVLGRTVLEIGSGSGRQMVYFAQQGAKLVTIDISTASLRAIRDLTLQHQFKNVQAYEMNAEKLDFPDNTFDFIYINSTMMHVDHQKVMKECRRVLKPQGKLVMVEPLLSNPLMVVYRLFSAYRKTKPKYMSVSEFNHWGKEFSSFSHREFYFWSLASLPLYKKNQERAMRISKRLEKIDTIILKVFPWLGRFCWVGVAGFKK